MKANNKFQLFLTITRYIAAIILLLTNTLGVVAAQADVEISAMKFNSKAVPDTGRAYNKIQADLAGSETLYLPFSNEITQSCYAEGEHFEVTTNTDYRGAVIITVSGIGQALHAAWQDAFYIFTDETGEQPVEPYQDGFMTLWINGEYASEFVIPVPSYNPAHIYSFLIISPGGPLSFAVGDPCPGDNSGSYTITIEPVQVNVGLVLTEDGVDDMSFNMMANQGLLQAESSLGVIGTLYEPSSSDDYATFLQQCVDDGNDLCFAVGFLMADAIVSVANANPDTSFAILDDYVFEDSPENLRGIQFDIKQVGYLAGALAGKLGNTVGVVGGMEIPPVTGFVEGYRNGAQCANPDANVLIEYTGTFVDPELGATTAQAMIDQGANVIFGVGGQTGNGAILYSAQDGKWSIGVDTDQYLTVFENGTVSGSYNMLTSAMKNLDYGVYQTVQDYINGSFTAGIVTYHLADGGVGLAPYHETDARLTQTTKDYVTGVRMGIIDGSVNVDETCRNEPSNNPTFSVRPELDWVDGGGWIPGETITVSIDDSNTGPGIDYSTSEVIMDSSFRFQVGDSYDIKPDDIVTVFGNQSNITKEHVVNHVAITNVDLNSQIAIGVASPNVRVQVDVHKECSENTIDITSDEDGGWEADFNGLCQIDPGDNLGAKEWDDDGDYTMFDFTSLTPVIWAHPNDSEEDWIDVRDWSFGETVHLTIDNDTDPSNGTLYTDSGVVGPANWNPSVGVVEFHLGDFELLPGQLVTVTSPTTTKVLAITNIDVTDIDVEMGTISGTADPNTAVQAWQHEEPHCNAEVFADQDGLWTVDFSQCNFGPGIGGGVGQKDSDEDSTVYFWWALRPDITAAPSNDWISGEEWPIDSTVTLEIDNPSTSENPDFSTSQIATQDGWREDQRGGNFQYWSEYDFSPGDIITLSDGATTKSLVVSDVQITTIDFDNDVVAGVTDPNRNMWVFVHGENGVMKDIQSDFSGNWSVDFTEDYDLEPGTDGSLKVFDDDGDQTHADWRVPNPAFGVRANEDRLEGWEWPLGSTVTIEVDDPSTPDDPEPVTITVEVAPWDPNQTWFEYYFDGYDLKAGDAVIVSDGTITKQLTVSDYSITGYDLGLDTVYGVADPDQYIHVWTCWQDKPCVDRDEMADESGNWSTSFAVPGEQDWEQVTADLRPGSWIDSSVSDEDGDQTMFGLNVPNPHLTDFPVNDAVEVWEWPDGSTVHLSVDDPATPQSPDFEQDQTIAVTTWGDPRTYARYEFTGEYDLKVGDVVTVTDGITPRTHVVQNLSVTAVNEATEIITGEASPGVVVYVWPHEYGEYEVQPTADEGVWLADFTSVGFDLQPGMEGRSEVRDEFGNSTAVDWNVPNPRIRALPAVNEVHGYDWPMGASVRLTIDEDTDPNNGFLYEDTKTVERMDWDWNHTEILFYLWEDDFTLQPSQYITMTDGNTIKTHWVTSLSISTVDPVADTVSGKAASGSNVGHWACDENGCANRFVITDENDDWIADFAHVGENDNEQDLLDIRAGVGGDVFQNDDDGDYTEVQWRIPNPNIRAIPNEDRVDGWDWVSGATAMLTIDDPYTEQNPDFSTQDQVGFDDGNGQTYVDIEFGGDYDLKPDDIVTLTDGLTTKTVIVTSVTVESVDVDSNLVTGTAEPFSQVWSAACQEDGCYQRTTTANSEGNWSIDFDEDVPGQPNVDIEPGESVDGEQFDGDGDSTMFTWYIPNPNIQVRANFDHIEGYEWPAGATVTIEIDDPGTQDNPDESYTATVGIVPWDPNQTYFELNLWDEVNYIDILPGFVVTVTYGEIARQHTVVNLEFTDIDIDADIVTGTAVPDGQIDIWACEFNNCFNIDGVPVDGTGYWSANFQGIHNIQPGTWIDSIQRDEQGNGTMFGIQTPGAEITGTIYEVESVPGNEVGGVMVEACSTDQSICRNALTDESGNYTIPYLPIGEFNIKAYPAGDGLPGYSDEPINITEYITYYADDIVLSGPPPSPPSGAIVPSHEGGGTISVYIGDDLTLTAKGCGGGTASFTLTVLEDGYIRNGEMAETSDGTYTTTTPPLSPHHGVAKIVYTIHCPDGSAEQTPFFIYIDPSGVVIDTNGIPVENATVILLYSDNPDGPFSEVPDGSVMMSPSNRSNPDTTDENGQFGWDVVAGFYKVRVEKPGCVSPTDSSQTFVESGVLTIPPPVTDLELVLYCPGFPTADAGADLTVNEGDLIILDASASSDPDAGELVYAWDLDNDGAFDDASGMTTEWIFPDNGLFNVGLKVTDSEDLSDTDTVEIDVLNVAPQITSISAPIAPVQVMEAVTVSVSFIDPGADDTHTALINWGDGFTSDGAVSGYFVTASHAYTTPGVYTLTITVSDDDGGDSTEYYSQYLVVFDPDGGFVTGGGWFRDPVTSDKANFGFNAKYNMDVKMPFGNTNFKVDDLHFKSTSYDWLVIYGAKAQYKGKGTINGTGEYEFSVTAIDGAVTGNGVDYFRIRIWDKATGIIMYDNDPGIPDNADPTVSLGGGSIVIHK